MASIGSEWKKWDLHLHTASSYDYRYKNNNADELLCQSLRDNHVAAVAITDHFRIDKERIEHLRSLAPEIVFFPGVELRTDKGGNNLHLILIFSEKSNLDNLSQDFDVIMRRSKAKSPDSDEKIYWDFNDIIDFAKVKEHPAIISIHAGNKANGIDQEIKVTDAVPYKDAVKDEIAKSVSFFEIGRLRDIETYHQYVFPSIGERPLIICSDNHDPRHYVCKSNLWIKADCTFEGLKQCLYQPAERIFIGDIPPVLNRTTKNAKSVIQSISVVPISTPRSAEAPWFDFSIPLNPGLVAIIGNKGSGKSALSDIIGLLCKCSTMDNASFLNSSRFRKKPKCYASDYQATIQWQDGHSESAPLDKVVASTEIEDAQYLPQKYIEDVCNDIGDKFQQEINKVIFSYVDISERGNSTTLEELIASKSSAVSIELDAALKSLKKINDQIILLEKKKTTAYKEKIEQEKSKAEEILQRHESEKPKEVPKPKKKDDDDEYQERLSEINLEISSLKEKIAESKKRISNINIEIDNVQTLVAKINNLHQKVIDINASLKNYWETYVPDYTGPKEIILNTPIDNLIAHCTQLNVEKAKLNEIIGSPDLHKTDSLTDRLFQSERKKSDLIRTATIEEQNYQKYLHDLEDWKTERVKILGGNDQVGLNYYNSELEYLNKQLQNDYDSACHQRVEIVKHLFLLKESLVKIYQGIYNPVAKEIHALLNGLDKGIEFDAEIKLSDHNLADKLLRHINQRYSGRFKGKNEAQMQMESIIKATDFSNIDSVFAFTKEIMDSIVGNDYDMLEKKVDDKTSLYEILYSLQYINVSFSLKLGGRDLVELSPGERGIVLLIFYMALSQSNMPIIVDQPEDNLDNQSVYGKLVPCICAAKKKRQVIIVTHNPNIAVACDAEQVIFCHMDKATYQITYEPGSIENGHTRQEVVDVLEGTMPAFNLRKLKYEIL